MVWGFAVFVLVEAMFPSAGDWSSPRIVMGLAAVVTRALDRRRGVGRGGRR
ncbi:hypothetical protein [Pseudonocardia sp. ICBG601]|uniref:hypothetical protein n=1 Tax=Pseudonocardia sp. ICBG601 TaxID=2846759 RepID=UPI001CF70004|nr:hypothetical protein [Pseudonocardia sp. ICBG601]